MMKLKPNSTFDSEAHQKQIVVYLQIHNTFCKNNYLILIWYAYILRQWKCSDTKVTKSYALSLARDAPLTEYTYFMSV